MSGCIKSVLFQRMPLAGILLFTVLLASLLFAGCTSDDNKPETDDSSVQNNNNNNNVSNNEWTNVGNYEWIVEPKFDYEYIILAMGGFQSDLRIIDPKTGELTGETVGGIGGFEVADLAYDENRKIWGKLSEYNYLKTYSSLSELFVDYHYIDPYSRGTFIVRKIYLKTDKFGSIDPTSGNPDDQYERTDKFALANRNGLITDFAYDDFDMHRGLKTLAVKQEGKWGFIDETGKLIIAYEFEDAISIDDETAFVKKNGLWGIIRKGGSN